MFYNFRNLQLTLNNLNFAINECQLQSEIELLHPLKSDDRVSEKNLPNNPYKSSLRLRYFLTGSDPLKPYLYSLENQKITGNFAGFTFSNGYVSDYSVIFGPNAPIEINANLEIFDKVSGNFNPTPPIINTGIILRTSDIKIDNLSNYTTNSLNNILQASFNYSCQLNPSYSYDISGIAPLNSDRVSIENRKWNLEVISDSTNFDIPLSGEKFAITISGINPFDSSINESFSASGVIFSKQFNISANKVHSHVLRLTQQHSNNYGGISGIIINTNNFEIHSTPNSHPFTNQNLSCIDKIILADVDCTGFIINKLSNNDKITVPIPDNIINGPLTIYNSKGNLIYPNTIQFNYPNITITGVSQYTGYPGTPVYISGTNFYRISQVNYGGTHSNFQIISPNLILSIVPNNGVTNKIEIISDLRQKTGYSNSIFYCKPEINSLTPVTGIWKDNLILGGINFSGTTGIKFGTGFVDAFSYTILDNQSITLRSPQTGAGFSEGYVSVLTLGGYSQSISKYSPQVPTYSFTGLSGIYYDPVLLSLIVDSGYLSPTGGGYKVRLGGIDTVFYQNGTGLSGKVPFGAVTDYIYIYKPDGISTYTPHPSGYIVHAIPQIYSITPATIPQYKYFNPVIIGSTMEFFTSELPYFFAISGGIDGDMQTTKNIISNSGGNADTLSLTNFIVTGSTGYYDILVQNYAGTGIFKSGLYVTSGINLATNCLINTTASRSESINIPSYVIDGSTGTYFGMYCTPILSGNTFNVYPRSNGVIDFNMLLFKMINLNSNALPYYPTANPSGQIALYYKNANKPFYSSTTINLSGYKFLLFGSGITGVRTIKISTPKVTLANSEYLGVSELQIF